ncbi:MAG: cell division protein FtsX [Anaeromassilibacillus sp.]
MRKIKTVRTQKKRSGSRLSSLGYLLKEGVKNIWSNRTMSFASVGVLVSCLLLTGAAVLFSMNVDVAMKSLEGNNSTTVYLQEGLPTLTSLRVGQEIKQLDNIEECEFVSSRTLCKICWICWATTAPYWRAFWGMKISCRMRSASR